MHLDPDDLHLVQRILSFWAPGIPAFAFGSRVHGRNLKPFSDLDLCLKGAGAVDANTLADVSDAFAASRLPFRVDVVDWYGLAPDFQNAITGDLTPIGSEQLATAE